MGIGTSIFRNRQKLAIAGAALVLVIPAARADVVVLKQQGNSAPRTLQGTVMSVNEQSVLLQIPDGTQVPLNRNSVLQIIFSRDHVDQDTEQQILTHPPVLDTGTDETSAPVPAPANLPAAPSASGSVTFALMDGQGVVNDDLFILLSRFKGMGSSATYAGLYNFDNKGTFWIRLPDAATMPGELSFSLFGKQNSGGNDSMEPFSVTVRFIDENGMALGESSSMAYRKTGDNTFI